MGKFWWEEFEIKKNRRIACSWSISRDIRVKSTCEVKHVEPRAACQGNFGSAGKIPTSSPRSPSKTFS